MVSLPHLTGLRRSGPLQSETSEISMKTYNFRLNTILPSGRASELVHVIASLNGLPQMAARLPHLAVYQRSGFQWLETSPMQCQWIHSDTDLYLTK